MEIRYTLWGGPPSTYSAKVRSYLIKKRIPYRELYPSHPDYLSRIIPKIGFFVVPVLETPDGEVIQDTSEIIDYLEQRFPEPGIVPPGPVQRVVAALICAFGSEGLNQPSMHYRWSFLDRQRDFLVAEFGRAFSAAPDRMIRAAAAAPVMSSMQDHLPSLGITAETIPAIEESYFTLLDILDRHFLEHPYVLGDRPSIADFGFMASLYAHLARDPVPSMLMKLRAPNVHRWTERMNTANFDDGEFWQSKGAFPDCDTIPATIEPLLAHIFSDWGPELAAGTVCYNTWIASRPDLSAGSLVSRNDRRQLHPTLGEITYTLRGQPMRRNCLPQSLWHFDKVSEAARRLSGDARTHFDTLAERTGGSSVMALRLARPIRRENNVLVIA